MRPRPTHHTTTITRRQAAVQLWTMLCSCTDTALAAFEPEFLHRNYNVPLAECARMLLNARQDRVHD